MTVVQSIKDELVPPICPTCEPSIAREKKMLPTWYGQQQIFGFMGKYSLKPEVEKFWSGNLT